MGNAIMSNIDKHRLSPAELKKLLRQKWPEAASPAIGLSEPVFPTGIERLDALFPGNGIPCGQLIEITGTAGCGKTSLLFKILASLTRTGSVAYVDFSGSFFPSAAASCGVDVSRLLVVTPEVLQAGLRIAELLLAHRMVCGVVLDLTGRKGDSFPPALLHRLRRQTARARALVIFLTENDNEMNRCEAGVSDSTDLHSTSEGRDRGRLLCRVPSVIIPASAASLKLEVHRIDRPHIEIVVAKSRISRAGARLEVALDG